MALMANWLLSMPSVAHIYWPAGPGQRHPQSRTRLEVATTATGVRRYATRAAEPSTVQLEGLRFAPARWCRGNAHPDA